MKKRLFRIFSLLLVLFLIVGCSSTKVFEEKDFKITLPNSFKKGDLESVNYYYESNDALVTALKESFEDLSTLGISKDSTIEDYVKLIIESNEKDDHYELKDNYAYFEYEATVEDNDFYYIAVTYKGKDAFWLVNFMCTKEDKSYYKKKFFEWADSVEI